MSSILSFIQNLVKYGAVVIFGLAVAFTALTIGLKPFLIWFGFDHSAMSSVTMLGIVSTTSILATVCWALTLINLISDSVKIIQNCFKDYIKVKHTLMIFEEPTGMKALEIAMLVAQKHRDKRTFLAPAYGCASDLEDKGLLTKSKYINELQCQFTIPSFVWKSKYLENLMADTENVKRYVTINNQLNYKKN